MTSSMIMPILIGGFGNTSISLFLAGLLSKLSIFGIIKFILCTFYLSLRFLSSILIYIILIGIVIINSSYFRYYDLKKIIALSSILSNYND